MNMEYLGNQKYALSDGSHLITFLVGGRNRVLIVLPDGAISGTSQAFAHFERIFKPGRVGWFLTSEGEMMCNNAVRNKRGS